VRLRGLFIEAQRVRRSGCRRDDRFFDGSLKLAPSSTMGVSSHAVLGFAAPGRLRTARIAFLDNNLSSG